jgi:lauroyl/myristoyl acyltransferase
MSENPTRRAGVRAWWQSRRLAPDGKPRPHAPFGRGPIAARALAAVIDSAAWVGARTPPRLAHGLAVFGGTIEWALRPALRRRLAGNLAHAIDAPPDDRRVRRLVRREIVNEARRSADLLWSLGRPDEFRASVVIEGAEPGRRALEDGHGMILAGLHLGGWEVATAVPGMLYGPPTTVIVADDWLAWAMQHLRMAAGLHIAYRTDVATRAARLLRSGEVLLLLGDDGWGNEPRLHQVQFLGTDTDLPAGLASLSRLCQSPIVGFVVLPLGRRRWKVILDPPIAPPERHGGADAERAVLQQLADRWSDLIRAHPDHWAARYRVRWKDLG